MAHKCWPSSLLAPLILCICFQVSETLPLSVSYLSGHFSEWHLTKGGKYDASMSNTLLGARGSSEINNI
ncbi:hypothetical protein Lal_00036937 [Lupinus albus]|nr:hypothetical protein Lal_00036937 [Lupinus albus]